MPTLPLEGDARQFYRDDDFTDPWRPGPPMILLHGNAESGLAWNGWMPRLARQFRVVRPDMRGFGRSTPMPIDHAWSLDGLVGDVLRLADALALDRFHLVAAKIGGPIAMRMAARHPDRLRSLAVLGAPVSAARSLGHVHAAWIDHIERHGVESWARWTMTGRLGAGAAPEMADGWARLMAATPLSTQVGFIRAVPAFDVVEDLPHIACPTLVVTTEASGLDSVAATRAGQERIPDSELLVLPGDSYHVAATAAEACARAVCDFIARRRC